MTILYSLLSLSCFLSLINLLFVIMLSNSIFRALRPDPRKETSRPEPEGGLVDLKYSPTYDIRFRQ
jgi:hypothetical protein